MFLITTADERTWKKDEPLLFAGDWCKLYSRRHIWSKLNHKVLPYHWDDHTMRNSDYKYLQHLYDQYLIELAQKV